MTDNDKDCLPLDDGPVGAPISLADAVAWTANYQNAHEGKLRSVYFTSDVFQALINQSGAKGIRIYLGNASTSSDSIDTMILVSATEDADLTTAGEYQLYQHGSASPPCAITSPLSH